MSTIEERFASAVRWANENGAHVRVNVKECCRSCIGHEKLGLPDAEALGTTPFAFHYGGQGNELVWLDGQPFRREPVWAWGEDEDDEEASEPTGHVDHLEATVYFNHGGPKLVSAQILKTAFEEEGFSVAWDGSTGQCVEVTLS